MKKERKNNEVYLYAIFNSWKIFLGNRSMKIKNISNIYK